MTKHLCIFFIGVFLYHSYATAQCTTLGQTPQTAFPVCGTSKFVQETVPICGNTNLVVPGCSGNSNSADYQNKNPFYYKFTCFAAGKLGFIITPNDLGDDYDWQLYDVTGRSVTEIFTNAGLVVTGNWSATPGTTGTRNGGVDFIQCASIPSQNKPNFAAMPSLILGHNYILLISHYTNSQSGYSLSFGGGSASITDPKLPALSSAEATCDAQQVRIFLNKKMKCNSLSPDGGDFKINTAAATIIAAKSSQCAAGFDMDSLTLTLSKPLPPGNYKITIKRSTDGNTLLDNCDREIPVDDNLLFTVKPLLPTPFDSITKPGCAPQALELVFGKEIFCNSIAADGSNFIIGSGPAPVTIIGAAGSACPDASSKKIIVQLSTALLTSGTYIITLKQSANGANLVDACGQPLINGQTLAFYIADTVNAAFTYSVVYACDKDVVQYNHRQRNNVNSWQWNFGAVSTSSLQNPLQVYSSFEPQQVQLIVSNGVCIDTSQQTLVLDNFLKAAFDITNIVCPNEPAKISNKSIGTITQWNWTFGNGNTSMLKDPPAQLYNPLITQNYTATPQLIIQNDFGCYDTIKNFVRVPYSCFIAVPAAFTPNGDGLNDYLYPLSAYKASKLIFRVYNRFGQQVFYSTDWQQKWDGTFKGQKAEAGTYVWVLSYFNNDTRRQADLKGTSILIR